jgi:hypothetical protein
MVGLASMLTTHWPAQRETVCVDPIPIYMVLIRTDHTGFDVEVIGADGSCKIVRGFNTMADVQAWVVYNKLLTDTVCLGEPSSFRTSCWCRS